MTIHPEFAFAYLGIVVMATLVAWVIYAQEIRRLKDWDRQCCYPISCTPSRHRDAARKARKTALYVWIWPAVLAFIIARSFWNLITGKELNQ
ncbi:hypothetical protein [Nesterenkonia suensis]